MTNEPSQDEQPVYRAPGKVLREAREASGMTQAEVATRLRLSAQIIKDIEADDYSHFSAAIYVHGYLRHYASIMGLESQPLIDAFTKMGFLEQLSKASQVNYVTTGVSRAIRSNHSKKRIARWMSGVMMSLFVALIAAWWYGQRHHKHADIATNLLTAGQHAEKIVQHSLPLHMK